MALVTNTEYLHIYTYDYIDGHSTALYAVYHSELDYSLGKKPKRRDCLPFILDTSSNVSPVTQIEETIIATIPAFEDARRTDMSRTILSSEMPAVKNSNYTIGENDYFVRCDGSFNIQLPDPSLGRREIKLVSLSPGETVTIKRYGSEKINMIASDFSWYTTYTSAVLTSDLTDWYIEGANTPSQ